METAGRAASAENCDRESGACAIWGGGGRGAEKGWGVRQSAGEVCIWREYFADSAVCTIGQRASGNCGTFAGDISLDERREAVGNSERVLPCTEPSRGSVEIFAESGRGTGLPGIYENRGSAGDARAVRIHGRRRFRRCGPRQAMSFEPLLLSFRLAAIVSLLLLAIG